MNFHPHAGTAGRSPRPAVSALWIDEDPQAPERSTRT